METILITGGTGLIGKELSVMLANNGYRIIILTRNIVANDSGIVKGPPVLPNIEYAYWNIEKQIVDVKAIQAADHLIHLTGAGVAEERWTDKRKIEIRQSRTESGAFLVKCMQEIPNRIRTVVSASAIGWYGADPDQPHAFLETDPSSTDFLGETCRLWEESIAPVTIFGKRLVILRTGIVVSKDGGAIKEFKKPIRFGIAAILGSGKQIISWIHSVDLCRIYLEALKNDKWQGPYNAVAPHPVNNKMLIIALAKRLRGRFFIPLHIPGFLLRIVLGEMSIEVLKSTSVSASKIHATGFQFICPTIDSAIIDI